MDQDRQQERSKTFKTYSIKTESIITMDKPVSKVMLNKNRKNFLEKEIKPLLRSARGDPDPHATLEIIKELKSLLNENKRNKTLWSKRIKTWQIAYGGLEDEIFKIETKARSKIEGSRRHPLIQALKLKQLDIIASTENTEKMAATLAVHDEIGTKKLELLDTVDATTDDIKAKKIDAISSASTKVSPPTKERRLSATKLCAQSSTKRLWEPTPSNEASFCRSIVSMISPGKLISPPSKFRPPLKPVVVSTRYQATPPRPVELELEPPPFQAVSPTLVSVHDDGIALENPTLSDHVRIANLEIRANSAEKLARHWFRQCMEGTITSKKQNAQLRRNFIFERLEVEMNEAVENKDFERAAELQNLIKSLRPQGPVAEDPKSSSAPIPSDINAEAAEACKLSSGQVCICETCEATRTRLIRQSGSKKRKLSSTEDQSGPKKRKLSSTEDRQEQSRSPYGNYRNNMATTEASRPQPFPSNRHGGRKDRGASSYAPTATITATNARHTASTAAAPRVGGIGGSKQVLCRFFRSPRGCRFGDNCRFVHA